MEKWLLGISAQLKYLSTLLFKINDMGLSGRKKIFVYWYGTLDTA